ncbi:MAG: 3-phosphoshikimate 1-carboxyvinyltransferase [Clostridia bacterium]|nr:3-phosphoshikimate 1-carboxyvinyltransferase [Clostridia bacterium]
MTITLNSHAPEGRIDNMPASKSIAHRAFICACFAQGETEIECDSFSEDIQATVGVIKSLGAEVTKQGNRYTVIPVKSVPKEQVQLDFFESGSTMRFILPILGALGIKAEMLTRGRLTTRPLSPLYEILSSSGMILSPQGICPLYCEGKLNKNNFSLDAGVSSQFISGLLFALSLSGGGTVEITGSFESRDYVYLTCDILKKFGIQVTHKDNKFTVSRGKITSPGKIIIESDWSNAAFWLSLGALSRKGISVSPLNLNSVQGDIRILDILKKFGAEIITEKDSITVRKGQLSAIHFDARDIPDLVPVISVVAAASEGVTVIDGISRLRIKESDRVHSVCEMLGNLGIKTQSDANSMKIYGGKLTGGTVDSFGDHRIVMSASIASFVAEGEVTINNARAVNKSYPTFFGEIGKLGAQVKEK